MIPKLEMGKEYLNSYRQRVTCDYIGSTYVIIRPLEPGPKEGEYFATIEDALANFSIPPLTLVKYGYIYRARNSVWSMGCELFEYAQAAQAHGDRYRNDVRTFEVRQEIHEPETEDHGRRALQDERKPND